MARKDPEKTQKIRDRAAQWHKYWRINRDQYYEWWQFVMGEQWREDESKLFERYNKIPLTMNKLGVLANHLIGEQLQNTPQLQIEPEGNVPEKTAEVYGALIKQISLNSEAQQVYQNAFSQSVIGGFGAYRVGLDYMPRSFKQELKLYDVRDPCKCYWDLSAVTESKTDGMFCGELYRMSRKKFAGIYGKDLERSIGSIAADDNATLAFSDDDSITLVMDYEAKYKKKKLYSLSSGDTLTAEEFKKLKKVDIDGVKLLMYNDEPVTVTDTRDEPSYEIEQTLIAGDYVLEEEDFPSEILPIIFVDQKSYYNKDGQQICRPFFLDVHDAQRYLNYLATQSAYVLKVSRFDQFMAPRKCVQASDTQAMWKDPSAQQGALVYDESTSGNKPEQLRPPELSASLTQQYERCLMDIQTGTGIYNAQLGDQGSEISGKAIDARTKRGSYNTYIPYNSLNRSIVTCGQIISCMIPKVYNDERMMLLSLPNRQNAPVTLNKPKDEYTGEKENDMTQGRYRIRLVPGPSYDNQKTEALESMQMILQADPTLFKLIGDLYVENLPVPNNIELRNRIRTIIPPEIIEAGKTGEPIQQQQQQPDPNAILAELKQKELQLKEKQAQLDYQAKMQELQLKQAELQRKAIETHQDMTMEWQKFEKEKEEAAAQLQETILRFQGEMHKTNTDAQMAHAANLVKLLTHNPKQQTER